MRPLVAAILVLLILTGAVAGGVANAQAVPGAPAGPHEPDGAPPAAPGPQAADHEQPSAARPQAADREQPPRVRQRNGGVGAGRKHVGLLIGGLITLGASYGFSAAVGLQLMSRPSTGSSNGSSICTNCDTVGGRLLFPVAGPWAALPASASGGKPILVGLGIAQAVGLIMTIVGAGRLNDDTSGDDTSPGHQRPAPQWRSNGRVSFLVAPSRDGAFGFLSGSL